MLKFLPEHWALLFETFLQPQEERRQSSQRLAPQLAPVLTLDQALVQRLRQVVEQTLEPARAVLLGEQEVLLQEPWTHLALW